MLPREGGGSPQTVSKSPFSLKQNWGGKGGRGRDVPQRGANVFMHGAWKRRLKYCTRVNSG